jgi:hypothetical protein
MDIQRHIETQIIVYVRFHPKVGKVFQTPGEFAIIGFRGILILI